jgi:hypothetical protein
MSTGRGQIAPAFFRRKTNEQSHADILVDLPIALGGVPGNRAGSVGHFPPLQKATTKDSRAEAPALH